MQTHIWKMRQPVFHSHRTTKVLTLCRSALSSRLAQTGKSKTLWVRYTRTTRCGRTSQSRTFIPWTNSPQRGTHQIGDRGEYSGEHDDGQQSVVAVPQSVDPDRPNSWAIVSFCVQSTTRMTWSILTRKYDNQSRGGDGLNP